MKVLKFGGTSVGTVESLSNVKKIVESLDDKVVVVVSALGGLTDKLISTARTAALGDAEYIVAFNEIFERHQHIIDSLISPSKIDNVRKQVYGLLDELGTIYRGIHLIRDLSGRTLDVVVSYGERMSSVIVSNLIDNAMLLDSKQFIITQRVLGNHRVDSMRTSAAIRKFFGEAEFSTAVVPGFISSDRDSDITNLGRGGSDYTAAILASALDAEILEIWTDVDGFMTADPRIVKDAYVIDELSFSEAIELCNYGAKVIYPPTLFPVYEKDIPIKVKNTFNPGAPGTLIKTRVDDSDSQSTLKGLSYVKESCIIRLYGPLAGSRDEGLEVRVADLLRGFAFKPLLVERLDDHVAVAVGSADAEKTVKFLQTEFASELQTGMLDKIEAEQQTLSTVAIIGADEVLLLSLCNKVKDLLRDNGIDVALGSSHPSGLAISFMVSTEKMRDALITIHNSLFLSQR